MDNQSLGKLFEGIERLAFMAVIFFLIAIVTVPIAIWKLVELIW
jgi:hypothetical protein